MPVRSVSNRPRISRQLALFVLAVLGPSIVLIAFGARFIRQEQRLAETRLTEDRVYVAREFADALSATLDDAVRMAEEELAQPEDRLPRYPADTVLRWLGTMQGNTYLAPWELNGHPDPDHPLSDPAHRRTMRRVTAAEYSAGSAAGVLDDYERISRLARDPVQRDFAGLGLARALVAAGRGDEGADQLNELLREPSSVADEFGIPVTYYAADLALDFGSAADSVLARLAAETDDPDWFTPERVFMLRDLVRKQGTDSTLLSRVDRMVDETENLLGLRVELPGLTGTSVPVGEAVWRIYGDSGWIVSAVARDSSATRHVFAVDVAHLVSLAGRLERNGVTALGLTTEGLDPTAQPLRTRFPDLYVLLSEGSPESRFGILFYTGLLLVLGLALSGGLLYWRDVRRENQLMRLRSQFVSSVSHELRTPLASIRLYAESMMMNDTESAEERQSGLRIITQETERLTRLLNNVLNTSRIEQGTMRYARRPESLQDTVRAATDAMQYVLSQAGATLEMALDETVPVVSIDRDAVEQAVLNLLSNAVKYGGPSPRIRLAMERREGAVHIAVSDSGPGIPEGEADRLFDRFYRSPSHTEARIPGTGLGLALVRHIAEAHDGRVTVRSEAGQGSTFEITLPIAESP